MTPITKGNSRQICLAFIFAFLISFSGIAASRDYYQIQVFRLTGKVQEEKVDNFLKSAYLPALHRAGILKIGVFKPIESDTTCGKRVYVWIPFKSLDHFQKVQGVLALMHTKTVRYLPVQEKTAARDAIARAKTHARAPKKVVFA